MVQPIGHYGRLQSLSHHDGELVGIVVSIERQLHSVDQLVITGLPAELIMVDIHEHFRQVVKLRDQLPYVRIVFCG